MHNRLRIYNLAGMLLVLLLGMPLFAIDTLSLPTSGFALGWQATETRTFSKQNLYGYIDGGAELFLEFGFSDLQLRKYVKEDGELVLERYRMQNADAALGIYLMKCGREARLEGLAGRHSGDRYQIMLLKGEYLFIVNNFSGKAQHLATMITLLNQAAAGITTAPACKYFALLPIKNLQTDSLRLLRGQYSVQSIITLGEGDILQLNGQVFAVTGDYRSTEGEAWSRLAVEYASATKANAIFTAICSGLDPTLNIRQKTNRRLVFFDGHRYGIITITGAHLDMQFNLSQLPR